MSSKVLVLVSHPSLKESRINDAFVRSLEENPLVTVRHIDQLIPAGLSSFDVTMEQEIIDAHDAVVFQFPWFWYSPPASLKKYLDEILTPGWAYRGGNALADKPVMVAISTGGPADAYRPEGSNKFTMEDFLAPLIATANMTKMIWQKPFVIHSSRTLSDDELTQATQDYLGRIVELTPEAISA